MISSLIPHCALCGLYWHFIGPVQIAFEVLVIFPALLDICKNQPAVIRADPNATDTSGDFVCNIANVLRSESLQKTFTKFVFACYSALKLLSYDRRFLLTKQSMVVTFQRFMPCQEQQPRQTVCVNSITPRNKASYWKRIVLIYFLLFPTSLWLVGGGGVSCLIENFFLFSHIYCRMYFTQIWLYSKNMPPECLNFRCTWPFCRDILDFYVSAHEP